MAMEIKQVHKLSQQLVMTPQLQQAIKLLQMSRMELVESVREEMLENPILEDATEIGEVTPRAMQMDAQPPPEGQTIDQAVAQDDRASQKLAAPDEKKMLRASAAAVREVVGVLTTT